MPAPGQEAALAEIIAALEETAAPATTDPARPTPGAEPGPSQAVAQNDPGPDSTCPPQTEPDYLKPRCALCRLVERSAERSLRAFFAEFVNDPEVRVRFRKSRGFCREHLPLLARCGDALGVAILYADLADETVGRWRSGGGAKRSPFARWLPADRESACPSCAAEADAETRYASALVDGIARESRLWQLLEAGEGLCARHVEQVATAARPADAARLLAMAGAKMETLLAELQEFVRKNDYRFRGEPWGPERDSWRRALPRLRRR